MLETLYIADKTLDELKQLFDCEINNDDDFYDVIAYNIVQIDKNAILGIISALDDKRLRAAIFGLGLSDDEGGIFNLLVGFLNYKNPMIVAETLDAFKNLRTKELLSTINNYFKHESDYVRAAALRYVVACNESIDGLEDYFLDALKDDSPIVRESAVDELADLGDMKYLNKITELKNDQNRSVREAVESAIDQLLGK